MERKSYKLRCGSMYLQSFETSSYSINTNFIKSIEVGDENYGVYELSNEKEAYDLSSLLYIASGIKFEVEENEEVYSEDIGF